MTPEDRLKVAHDILYWEDAVCASESISMDLQKNKPVTDRERALKRAFSALYQTIHPAFCDAGHKDWEAQVARRLAARAQSSKTEPVVVQNELDKS